MEHHDRRLSYAQAPVEPRVLLLEKFAQGGSQAEGNTAQQALVTNTVWV